MSTHEIVEMREDGTGYVMRRPGVPHFRVTNLEVATRDAFFHAVVELALHIEKSKGHEVFDIVRPKLPGWCEVHCRYAAIKSYCRSRMEAEGEPLTDLMFAYKHGVSTQTPCGVCGRLTIWGSCEMMIVRPCGHAVCRKHTVRKKCPVCKRAAASTFSRDSLYVENAVLDGYMSGFFETHTKPNDWFAMHFYWRD